MFIVWGTKSRQEEGGVVGDWCDVCRAPTFQRLAHFYKVGHVYYIPLGKGEYVGSTRKCTQCGTSCNCVVASYGRPLTHQEAHGRGIEQILEVTNPALLEQISRQRSFEYEIAQRIAQPAVPPLGSSPGAPAQGGVDPRMLVALQTLKTLDARDKDVVQFTERLQKWDYLTPSEREVLLHEIDTFATEDRKTNSAIHFIKLLPTPTPGWITAIGCLTAIGVVIVGLAAVPFLQSWLWGTLFVVAAAALWLFAYIKASNQAVRIWVRRVLIPKVRERDVDVHYFVGLLAGIKGSKGGYEEKIADMARNVDLIADELVKQGYLSPEQDSEAAAISSPANYTEIAAPTVAPADEQS